MSESVSCMLDTVVCERAPGKAEELAAYFEERETTAKTTALRSEAFNRSAMLLKGDAALALPGGGYPNVVVKRFVHMLSVCFGASTFLVMLGREG